MVATVAPRKAPAEKDVVPPVFGTSFASQAINLHKALTLPVVLLFMYLHNNFTQPAVLYALIHGIYGYCWILKHMNFRDKAFDAPVSIGYFFNVFGMVALYWIGPFMLTKYRKDDEVVPTWELVLVMALWSSGLFLHYVSDCQKFWILSSRGRGLITTGLFQFIRNPNYLGEVLIYCAFTLLCRSYAAGAVLAFFFFAVFIPNMRKKDASLSKYEDFEDYAKRTWLIFPLIL